MSARSLLPDDCIEEGLCAPCAQSRRKRPEGIVRDTSHHKRDNLPAVDGASKNWSFHLLCTLSNYGLIRDYRRIQGNWRASPELTVVATIHSQTSFFAAGICSTIGERYHCCHNKQYSILCPQSRNSNNVVFGLVRNPASAPELVALQKSRSNVHILQADVTDRTSIKVRLRVIRSNVCSLNFRSPSGRCERSHNNHWWDARLSHQQCRVYTSPAERLDTGQLVGCVA